MTAIEILNLDYYLDNNPKLKKFKDLTLLEEIKNNYILYLDGLISKHLITL
jgi:hypothetical protein